MRPSRAAEAETVYYRFGDGSVAERAATAGQPPPADATQIDADAYTAALAEARAAIDARRVQVAAEQEQRQADDYQALRTAGIAHRTAVRLSGYTGPDPE